MAVHILAVSTEVTVIKDNIPEAQGFAQTKPWLFPLCTASANGID